MRHSLFLLCFRLTTPFPLADFAHTLELLESEFYTQALAKFSDVDFTNAGFVSPQIPAQLFQVIQRDEAAHATFLEVRIALQYRPLKV